MFRFGCKIDQRFVFQANRYMKKLLEYFYNVMMHCSVFIESTSDIFIKKQIESYFYGLGFTILLTLKGKW